MDPSCLRPFFRFFIQEKAMSAFPDKFLHEAVTAKRTSIQPFAASEKIYVEGSRLDIRVPMRQVL